MLEILGCRAAVVVLHELIRLDRSRDGLISKMVDFVLSCFDHASMI